MNLNKILTKSKIIKNKILSIKINNNKLNQEQELRIDNINSSLDEIIDSIDELESSFYSNNDLSSEYIENELNNKKIINDVTNKFAPIILAYSSYIQCG